MKIIALSSSVVGSKTRTAMEAVAKEIEEKYPEVEAELINLQDYDLVFSDGRNYLEYEGDTKYVAGQIMEADAVIVGMPIFQASIPGSLKNVFDLLPQDGLRDKVASIVVTAGSSKHYLIPEIQLKPILSYMKAQLVPNYVFVGEQDVFRNEIISDDIGFRIQTLVEDTIDLVKSTAKIRQEREEEYGF